MLCRFKTITNLPSLDAILQLFPSRHGKPSSYTEPLYLLCSLWNGRQPLFQSCLPCCPELSPHFCPSFHTDKYPHLHLFPHSLCHLSLPRRSKCSLKWNKIQVKSWKKRHNSRSLWPGLKINYIMHIILENCGRSLRHNISTDQPSDWPPAYLNDQPTDWLTNRPFADSSIPLIFIIRGIKINNTFPHSPPTTTQNTRNTPQKSVANSPLPPKEIKFFLYIYSLR